MYAIITTIYPKREAVFRLEMRRGWTTLLVGDEKTPWIESSEKVRFLPVSEHHSHAPSLARISPFNHYSRKNIGYLFAIRSGASIIYDTDDDNLITESWKEPNFSCKRRAVLPELGETRYCNTYRHFTSEYIWPRGFPLRYVASHNSVNVEDCEEQEVGVWQELADGDPDVDAIFRLVFPKTIRFEKKPSFFLPHFCYCPFNSQNTFWAKRAFPYLYLPSHVSFRFTDILRGYVAQRLLWHDKLVLGFSSATAVQERNAHDLMKDFEQEVACYLDVEKVTAILNRVELGTDQLENLKIAYAALIRGGIVPKEEMKLVEAWNAELQFGPIGKQVPAKGSLGQIEDLRAENT